MPKNNTIATGLAMFSMFFGAGNVVFPLALGQMAQDKNFYAIMGMLITAVGMPFMGLIAMTLYDGDYHRFFGRIGKVTGFLVAAVLMGLIGSFGAIPRCIALSYSTAKMFLPSVPLELFALISCILIWLFTFRRTAILDTLGYVLTPILLISLIIIIVKGLLTSPSLQSTEMGNFEIFLKGLKDGYQTLDLPGALFFSSVILVCLKRDVNTDLLGNNRQILWTTLKASCIGAFLLSMIYVGFSYVSAYSGQSLEGISSDLLISMISVQTLGPKAAIVACVAVSLACLTTAIALSSVFAEFIVEDLSFNKIGYQPALLITLGIAYFVSTFNFMRIAAFLLPVLQIIYPALITLTFLNILYKLYGFKPVKIPVLLVFLLSVIGYFIA